MCYMVEPHMAQSGHAGQKCKDGAGWCLCYKVKKCKGGSGHIVKNCTDGTGWHKWCVVGRHKVGSGRLKRCVLEQCSTWSDHVMQKCRGRTGQQHCCIFELFRDHVWCQHGLPDSVVSDRGSVFASNFLGELYKLLGIKHKMSTAFHPQTDGQTERLNREINQYLHTYVND